MFTALRESLAGQHLYDLWLASEQQRMPTTIKYRIASTVAKAKIMWWRAHRKALSYPVAENVDWPRRVRESIRWLRDLVARCMGDERLTAICKTSMDRWQGERFPIALIALPPGLVIHIGCLRESPVPGSLFPH